MEEKDEQRRQEYIQSLKDVIRQYEDGAILGCEALNKIVSNSMSHTAEVWFDEEIKLLNW